MECSDATWLNDAPAETDHTVSTSEDTDYAFATADFGFSDPHDSPANSLLAVKMTTLPGTGTLRNNGVAVSAGDFIPVADINGGHLTFSPASGASGSPYTTFTFQVQDNGVTPGVNLDPSANTITVDIIPAGNHAPVIDAG